MSPEQLVPPPLDQPSLLDTAVWSWVRDRRFPGLASWFDREAREGRILVTDLIVMELIRITPNRAGAESLEARLAAFATIPMGSGLWSRAREVQILLSAGGVHRRVPPADLLIAAAAEAAAVEIVHYDRDYERISGVSGQPHRWFVADGSLA